MLNNFSLKKAFTTKTSVDLAWNYASLIILGLSGVIINIIIAVFYDAEALGVFNQVFAIYIFASQLAVGGVHYSVLKHVAQFRNDKLEILCIAYSGLALTFVLGTCVSAILYALSSQIGTVFNSEKVVEGVQLVAPAIVLFALNKVLLAWFNGQAKMRIFAIGQAWRYLCMMGYIVFASLNSFPDYSLSFCFVVSESLLLTLLSLVLIVEKSFARNLISLRWIQKHFIFGSKGFLAGVFSELNTRIDVLMIGYFMTDASVGIYSFVAILAEGVWQLLIVVRNVINPTLVTLVAKKDANGLHELFKRYSRILYPTIGFVCLAVYGGTLLVIHLFMEDTSYLQGMSSMAILLFCLFIASGFIPFDGIFTQSGYPEFQTFYQMILVICNVVMNILLIPVLGIAGAAIGTGSAFIIGMPLVTYFIRHKLKMNFVFLPIGTQQ